MRKGELTGMNFQDFMEEKTTMMNVLSTIKYTLLTNIKEITNRECYTNQELTIMARIMLYLYDDKFYPIEENQEQYKEFTEARSIFIDDLWDFFQNCSSLDFDLERERRKEKS